MAKLEGEIIRRLSPNGLVTTASGVVSAIEGHNLATQDLSINIARSGIEDLFARFGVAVAVAGLIIMLYSYRKSSQPQNSSKKI